MKSYKSYLKLMVIGLLISLLVTVAFGKFIYVDPVYNKKHFVVDEGISRLVIGASHSATGIDTDYLDNTLSVAISGEPLFFTYYKTKMLLDNNPQINELIVAISPIHVSQYAVQYLFSDNAGSRQYTMQYYFLLDDLSDPLIKIFSGDNILGYLKYRIGIPFNYMSDLRVVSNYYRGNISPLAYDFFGGVERQEGNHIDDQTITNKANIYFTRDGKVAEPAQDAITIINRLSQLTDTHDVKLTIISTPLHSTFVEKIPKAITKKYDETMQRLANGSSRVRFLDLSSFEVGNEGYLDGDHLNLIGNKRFSVYLEKRLSQ